MWHANSCLKAHNLLILNHARPRDTDFHVPKKGCSWRPKDTFWIQTCQSINPPPQATFSLFQCLSLSRLISNASSAEPSATGRPTVTETASFDWKEVFQQLWPSAVFTQLTSFPRKAKAIITVSTIPLAGASDFGVQSVVFGTTKAIAEVMGIKISHDQLAKAMPSTDSLRNWEFDLAGGCLASVIERIAKDALLVKQQTGMPLQISLITDHGNQEGVDHLVKMICWSSVDRNENRMLCHFNLDVDRGGHTYIKAENALSHSIT
eukprot:scaffold49687_cov33-Cyclotella_meneghiniana.AAC.1